MLPVWRRSGGPAEEFKRPQFRMTHAMTTPQTSMQLKFPTREECAVPDLLAARAAATPDKPFLLFEEETWSYGDAAREAWRTGNALIRAGGGCRDYEACCARNRPE